MTRTLIFIIAFGLQICNAQNKDGQKKYLYDMCIFKKAKPGHILKNTTLGIADTITAYVSGQILADGEPVSDMNVYFTDSLKKHSWTTTDSIGNYKIFLPIGLYSIKFFLVGYTPYSIDQLDLRTGQIQELSIELGTSNSFSSIQYTSDVPLTKKQVRAKEKELSDK